MKIEATPKPIEVRALEALGQGFDLSSDFRLKFSKGLNGSDGRLVVLNEANKRDIVIPSGEVTIHGVPEDIRCDKGDRIRFKSDVLAFNQVKASIFLYSVLNFAALCLIVVTKLSISWQNHKSVFHTVLSV